MSVINVFGREAVAYTHFCVFWNCSFLTKWKRKQIDDCMVLRGVVDDFGNFVVTQVA